MCSKTGQTNTFWEEKHNGGQKAGSKSGREHRRNNSKTGSDPQITELHLETE